MNINVHIERLILKDITVPHHQQPVLQVAVETELIRLLASDGLGKDLFSGGTLPQIYASTIQLSSDNNPAHLGRQIAQSLYVGI